MENRKDTLLFKWIDEVKALTLANKLSKINLSDYHGNDNTLKKCIIRPTIIKNDYKFSFTYQHKTKDIIKNYSIDEGLDIMLKWLNNLEFRAAIYFTEVDNTTLQYQPKSGWKFKKANNTKPQKVILNHNIPKKRPIDSKQGGYLTDLGLTNAEGVVFHKAQDKYKQINHYIDILAPILKNIRNTHPIQIADMGSGKGYLTFALYDFLKNKLDKDISIQGVEFREDLVQLCNSIAKKNQMDGLTFIQGTIDSYQANTGLDIIIALHACDTATDDAIFKGIESNASLIVVAPCCHKQIRREMESTHSLTPINTLTKYGIFLERQAEMITDGIRAMLLESLGYKVKIMEFISDQHTPKNVLIIAEKYKPTSLNNQKWTEIQAFKSTFGIQSQHLETLIKNSYQLD